MIVHRNAARDSPMQTEDGRPAGPRKRGRPKGVKTEYSRAYTLMHETGDWRRVFADPIIQRQFPTAADRKRVKDAYRVHIRRRGMTNDAVDPS